jgi:uncharacterized membrane protein YqgA involved in biofilm formation
MNPILKTILILLLQIVITFFCVSLTEDRSEMPFAVMIMSFYLAPLVCLLSFGICILFDKKWLKNNKVSSILFALILIGWLLWVWNYYNSL